MAKVKDAEVIVYATPIYYYEMCGQMKTLLDRLNPLYSTDYSFRDIYMIATAAENDESAFEKAYNGLQGWVDCFEKASLKGMVGGGGIDAANTAADHMDAMKKHMNLERNYKLKRVLLLSLCVLVLFGLAGCREKRSVSFENDISEEIIDNSTESQISAGELEETEITDKSAMDDEREYMKLYFNDTEIPVI